MLSVNSSTVHFLITYQYVFAMESLRNTKLSAFPVISVEYFRREIFRNVENIVLRVHKIVLNGLSGDFTYGVQFYFKNLWGNRAFKTRTTICFPQRKCTLRN